MTMASVQFMTAKQAATLIPDGAHVGTVGFLMIGVPEEVLQEVEKRFLETGSPKKIDLTWVAGIGDGGMERGLSHLCYEGLLNRVVGGHYGLAPKMIPLINENKIEAYNFPQGVMSQMYREMAGKRPGIITHIGLGTFTDPDFGGGKLNAITTEDLVEKITLHEKDYLFYHNRSLDVALVRGTEADEDGNISMRNEAIPLEHLSCAMAAHNNGGKVIVQVEKMVRRGTIPPKEVAIPGILVDAIVVVKDKKNHMQTAGTQFNEDFITANTLYEDTVGANEFLLDIRKIIARRAALEVQPNQSVLNFGIGIPEMVAAVLKEEGIMQQFSASVEAGITGGFACNGLDFGAALSPQAILDEPYQFDFYDGGGVDCTFLGMAECDAHGNLNVSKFGPKIAGCGGFIDISQNAKKCVFCGTFTAGGLAVHLENGQLMIDKDGKFSKFIENVEQITFNGAYEGKKNKSIILVTERAVFSLTKDGPVLIELAPGIDLERDVLAHMAFKPIVSPDLKVMDERIFCPELMGLKSEFI